MPPLSRKKVTTTKISRSLNEASINIEDNDGSKRITNQLCQDKSIQNTDSIDVGSKLRIRNSQISVLSDMNVQSSQHSNNVKRDCNLKRKSHSPIETQSKKSRPSSDAILQSDQRINNSVTDMSEFSEAQDESIENIEPPSSNGNFFKPSQMFQKNDEQRILEQIKTFNTNESCLTQGDVGHIQEITLMNFMCHSYFNVKFSPRVNFVLGPNGSGKSAILNGIVLGLGGRASATNRGSGLATFIKTGESWARILIKICNWVDDDNNKEKSYRFDKYGKSILVERTVNSNGQSTYKLKSIEEKMISDKKEELDNIVKYFSIFVDNPICVLTQEISKNFLNTKSCADKFKFFIKATQIEDAKKDYDLWASNNEQAAKLLENKKVILAASEKERKTYAEKVKIIEMLRNSVDKLESLQSEALWANIKELQNQLEKSTAQINLEKQKFDKLSQELNTADDKVESLNANHQNLEKELETFSVKFEEASQNRLAAEKQSNEIKKRLYEKASRYQAMKNDVIYQLKQIDDLKQRIQKIEQESRENKEMNIEAQIESKNQQVESKKQEEKNLKLEYKSLEEELENGTQKILHLKEEERKLFAMQKSHQSEVDRLSRSKINRLNRYGNQYTELVRRIDKLWSEKKFRKKPLGPIGEYIHLQNSSAAFAIEKLLGKTIFAFVVDNIDDANIMKKLISNLFPQNYNQVQAPTIIIRKFVRLFDVSRTQATCRNYQNFLQLMNIKPEDDAVANCLIDHHRVEKILFIPKYEEAQSLLIQRTSVPQNCILAYTADADVMYPSTSNSDYKCYPNTSNIKSARILIEDQEKLMNEYSNKINELGKNRQVYCDKIDEARRSLDDIKKKIEKLNMNIQIIKKECMTTERELNDLKKKAHNKPIEAEVLKEEVIKLEAEMENMNYTLEKFKAEKNELSDEFKKMIEELNEKTAFLDKVVNSREPIKKELENLQIKISKLKADKYSIEKQKTELKKNLDSLNEKYENEKKIFDEKKFKALEHTKNVVVETRRSYPDVMNEINRLNLMIREHNIPPDEQCHIFEKFNKLTETFNRVRVDFEKATSFFGMSFKLMKERKKAYHKMCYYITTICNHYFENILKSKDFIGHLHVYFNDIIDNETGVKKRGKTLEIEIKPRKEFSSQNNEFENCDTGQSYSSTKSLSGGERSFSTVGFIMSLWQICQSPFRILDEVDVFMDMVTRKISIDAMVDFATLHSNKQYIFLSPLQIQHLEQPNIEIFQMPEPERPN